MKARKMFYCLQAAAFLYAGTVPSARLERPDTVKSFNVNRGGRLVVDVPGPIKVNTWSKDEVKVSVTGLDEDQTEKVEITSDKNTVTVRCDEGWGSESDAEFNVTVPVNFNVELKTSSGNIETTGKIDGNVEASTSGGDLSFKDVTGNLNAESSGGNISLQGNVEGNLNVNTMGGDINIGVIKGKSAKVNTMGGEISISKCLSGISVKTYGGDISVGDAGGSSDFVTYGGNISVGKVNGDVNMETYGGNLSLSGANGKVKGRTNGGNIEFQNVNGSVDIKTMAGEIVLGFNPAPNSESKIITNMGSITLNIAASAKTEIEARIHVQGWWKDAQDNYKINSDFEAATNNVDGYTHDIVGTYILNGGGSKIFLKSVNDEITIKKSSK